MKVLIFQTFKQADRFPREYAIHFSGTSHTLKIHHMYNVDSIRFFPLRHLDEGFSLASELYAILNTTDFTLQTMMEEYSLTQVFQVSKVVECQYIRKWCFGFKDSTGYFLIYFMFGIMVLS